MNGTAESRPQRRRRPLFENPALVLWFLILEFVALLSAFLLLHLGTGLLAAMHLFAFSILTFLLFGWDKLRAKQGARRVSEMNLLLFAILGGGLGGVLGMLVWRHKGRRLLFQIVVPLTAFLQLSLLVVALVEGGT